MAFPLRPIVAICGTTGVGKSKLAIDLALHVKRATHNSGWRTAKIINADSMQVYRGLDVITNKMPESERQGVEHLMMGFKEPGEQYVVGEWVQDTLRLIDEMHENNILPIVVGGTSYWIQHLMFPNRLIPKETIEVQPPIEPSWPEDLLASIATLPPDLLSLLQDLPEEPPSAKLDPDGAFRLHSLLAVLDPVISQRWHWRDTRKVLRCLEIIKETRRRPSNIIAEQSNATTESKPRFRTLCFWLYAEPGVLAARLDARVDDMLSQGLLDEIRSLKDIANVGQATVQASEGPSSSDYTLGIYQSIGYREFCNYLESPTNIALSEALDRMKISTRQYAKRQISWIRNKLIPAVESANTEDNVAPMYLLDATALADDWVVNVETPAVKVLDSFLIGDEMPNPKTLSDVAEKMLTVEHKDVNPASVLQARQKRVCPVCTVHDDRPVMIEGPEWDAHQKTRSHRRLVAKKTRPRYHKESPGPC
ncbi:tRNA isopentenyltransferase [Crassisporium funariophilum]|nr:tRNA isopentenyltransferase [Crassisporium funariophilum]